MFATIVKKIFGSKSERDVKRLRPLVAKINALEEQYQSLTEEQLKLPGGAAFSQGGMAASQECMDALKQWM